MKTALIIGCSAIIVLGVLIYFSGPVDPVGFYGKNNSKSDHPIHNLHLNKDHSFVYQYTLNKRIIESRFIRGKYEITGKRLKLMVKEFEIISPIPSTGHNKLVVKSASGNDPISATVHPERFKKLSANFEAGSLDLKPVYFFRRVKGNLSLCLKDLKTGRFKVDFVKHKK